MRYARAKDGEERKIIPHRCDEKFCRRCFGTHEPRNCYIKKVDLPKEEKPRRIITFDFECLTGLQPDPKLMSFKHEVIFFTRIHFNID